ncbi:sensory box histidine kinase/response regulator [Olavius sp. associated proteobacterium Delta 1]|nr:sensory box histidine kinase/response regulator [Olavius sp. associated proteobacterium Delta 1]
MRKKIESDLNHLRRVYQKLINDHADLNRQLYVLLKELVFENRYTLHPSMLDGLAHEETNSFLSFLSSGDQYAVFQHGQERVNIGLGDRTILALASQLRNFCWDRLHKKNLQLLHSALSGVDLYISSYIEGYMSKMEAQILGDQEQMRLALSAALDQQRQELHIKNQAIHTYSHGIMLTDLNSKITYVNPAFIKMWGYDDFDQVLQADTLQFWGTANFNEFLKTLHESAGRQIELKGVCKDGSAFDAILSASFIKDEQSQPVGIMAFFIDATERNQLEAQLQRAQKMEALGTLAGGVAHDLNNILSGLISYPELLLLDLPEGSPLRKPIQAIHSSGQKMAAIVKDLLTLARRGVAATKVLNLNSIISNYLLSPEFERLQDLYPTIELQTRLDQDLLNILGSSVHLSKTVMNLVTNAAESMPGGGLIVIASENRYLDRPIRGYDDVKEGDYALLTVSDCGVGIPPKDLKRIFEPFYTKKIMGRSGTGLGMAVVWGTVKDHNGYIDVLSQEGLGSTFTLFFPVTRKELPKEVPAMVIEDYMGEGESVLVVDDVDEQRNIATMLLKRLGYSVTAVPSGEEAVDIMTNHDVDLLILDMIMDPGIDGLETYRKILKFNPNQKAIIVSGFSETERVKEAQKLGAGRYVRKPYLMEKIGKAVRAELDH